MRLESGGKEKVEKREVTEGGRTKEEGRKTNYTLFSCKVES